MRKTEEEIMKPVVDKLRDASLLRQHGYCVYETTDELYADHKEEIEQAMQTFAQQESEAKAVGFAEWLSGNAYPSEVKVGKWALIGHPSEYHTTAQLYAIYLKNKF